jgi:hypothetical protein
MGEIVCDFATNCGELFVRNVNEYEAADLCLLCRCLKLVEPSKFET